MTQVAQGRRCSSLTAPNETARQAAEFKYVFPGYSAGAASGAPWGFEHQGIDFIAARSSARVLAPATSTP
jgi:hypothetical protein